MQDQTFSNAGVPRSFGRRKLVPHICVIEAKPHVRSFLRDAFEDLHLVTCECVQIDELHRVLDAQELDIVVIGPSTGEQEARSLLNALAMRTFEGRVLVVAPPESPVVGAVQELSLAFGIGMLPSLLTPFSHEQLLQRVSVLLPAEAPPRPVVNVPEALDAGWLDLWYQPKVDTRTYALHGVEALVRLRHPTWGIVPPACFIPDESDPHLSALSDFVIKRAINDWRRIVERYGAVEMAINLPISCLRDADSVRRLCRHMPDHAAPAGMIVEVNSIDVIHNLALIKSVAEQLRFYRIAVSVDDLGEDWPALAHLVDFPFAEIKVDRQFVAGCADDRLKRSVCRSMIDLADGYGARTVAEGVEGRDDFQAVRELDFDLAQGFLFGRAMSIERLVRNVYCRRMGAAT